MLSNTTKAAIGFRCADTIPMINKHKNVIIVFIGVNLESANSWHEAVAHTEGSYFMEFSLLEVYPTFQDYLLE